MRTKSAERSQRGNPLLRCLDASLGPILIAALGIVIGACRLFSRRPVHGDTLLVCFGAIGDLLLLSAVARKVATDRRLVLACTPENKAAVSIYPDLFDDVLLVRLDCPWSLARACHRRPLASIIDSTQWANVSALQVGLVKLTHLSARLIGFRTATHSRVMVYDELITHSSSAHETQNFATLLGSHRFQPASLVEGSPATTRTIALHLWPSGTRSYLKEWPQDYWAELARTLHRDGYQLVITGSPADRDRNEAFIDRVGLPITNLAGAMNLRQVFDFFRERARACISVNTGTMHLAALAGTAVIAINGPTNPDRWGPVGPHATSLLPSAGNVAYLNYGFEYPPLDQDAYALDQLSPDTVMAAVAATLARLP